MKNTIGHKIFVLIILQLNIHIIYSQSIISGKIQDTRQDAIEDVSIMLMRIDSTIIEYVISDKNGIYRLDYTGNDLYLLLSASALDIKPQIKKIENRSQIVNFILEQGSIELQEVIVKSNKIWSQKDTINYLVSAFSGEKDIVIGDVLKKMPGINVAESGQISYQGKPINKFYIENLDMLGGRYGIATNNILVKDISPVQILANHQPIKALEKINISNEAAINLKIKEGRKGVFSLIALLSLGVDSNDALWLGELTGMYFGKKRQHISSYKTNNNGTNIKKELQSFTDNNSISELQMTSVQQPSPPNIRFERYNFNNTHTITSNNLNVMKNDAKFNTNIVFYHNKDKRHGFSRTTYLIPGVEEQLIIENISAQSTTNNIEGEFDYNLNKEHNYVNNNLKISGNWDDNKGDVITTKDIRQNLNNKSVSVTNNTRWVIRGKNEKGIEGLSKNSFRSQPHYLTITPGLYPDLFSEGEEYSSLIQNVRSNAFISNNRISFLSAIALGKLRLNPTVNLSMEHRTLQSDFDIIDKQSISHDVTDISMINDIRFTRVNSGLSLDATYNIEKFKLNLSFPLIYHYTDLDNRLAGNNSLNKGKFYFQPIFSARYNPSTEFEITANGSYNSSIPGLNSLYTGHILQNYRNINRYNDTYLFDSKNINSNMSVFYKNILALVFAGGDVSYSHYSSDGIYGQTLDGMLIVTEFMERYNKGNVVSISGHSSKGFNWKELLISINGSWGQSGSDQLRQKEFVKYKNQWLNANATIKIEPTTWLIAEYRSSWGRSKGKVSTGERFKAIQSLTQQMNAYISLPFGLNLNGSWEHYYNSVLENNKNFSLVDIGLGYTKGNTRYSLDWINILNTSKYVSASYGTLNSYYSEYDIRPMAIMLNVRFKLY